VNGSATVTVKVSELLRRIQTGFVQNYALLMFGGIVAIFIWLLFVI